jgi:hypothetical protein
LSQLTQVDLLFIRYINSSLFCVVYFPNSHISRPFNVIKLWLGFCGMQQIGLGGTGAYCTLGSGRLAKRVKHAHPALCHV